MGYRSQIHFTILGKRDAVISQIVAFRLSDPKPEEALKWCCFLPAGDDLAIKFHGDDWKWYPDYEDVGALTRLFKFFKDAEENPDSELRFEGAFVRVGEDSDDIETTYFGDDPYELEQVSRAVHSQFDFDESAKSIPV